MTSGVVFGLNGTSGFQFELSTNRWRYSIVHKPRKAQLKFPKLGETTPEVLDVYCEVVERELLKFAGPEVQHSGVQPTDRSRIPRAKRDDRQWFELARIGPEPVQLRHPIPR